jgi:hypothetical protein
VSATLLLDQLAWDLLIDIDGNIALATDPYSIAQDAASAIKLYLGELWYDTTQGVPYDQILGQFPSLTYIKSQLVNAALTVPEVVSAQVFISGFAGRQLSGQVQITTTSGSTSAASFNTFVTNFST